MWVLITALAAFRMILAYLKQTQQNRGNKNENK